MDPKGVCVETDRTEISLVTGSDAKALFTYFQWNQAHLAPWEPLRSETYHTQDAWIERAHEQSARIRAGSSYHFLVRLQGEPEIAAVCNFNNVIRGAFRACHLGMSVDHRLQGRGVMFEALDALMPFAFNALEFHRVMANYMPRNVRSGRLLQRLGFEIEGFARDYLKIAGTWEDHILTSRVTAETCEDR